MNKKLIEKFNSQAKTYDRMREKHFQQKWRKKLIGEAKGHVLELAVGAGGNFPFYRLEEIDSITAVDFSPEMLHKARKGAHLYHLPVRFIESDIEKLVFEKHKFDTVISTLSFCGYRNPLQILENVSTWCKPNGQVLLLEHGISSNFIVSKIQKAMDPFAVKTVGCHQDRNIMELISRSPLDIQKAEHHWMDVFHLIWAKPRKE
ncbi:class I SAM-dependent methyltransferase [Fictibacillus fluitans]|uniref:Class I SAM-dependent methyltransferase n=1 Tax=Fictibacillus fluitans TaxID=3058422 RepID=A0ABT8HQN1_9BACL|nr:class I SAM-dependent methyltransferase [Fictibacillus sp. NE201]MDN4523051.1 class I SAM-dependent methyltransferase [Fictibacillus sp. NE201]